jgi:hypothetical protein
MPAGVRNIPTAMTSPTTRAVAVRMPIWRLSSVWIGFALEVMSHVRFGFLAGCAVPALPRRGDDFDSWGYAPWCGLLTQ